MNLNLNALFTAVHLLLKQLKALSLNIIEAINTADRSKRNWPVFCFWFSNRWQHISFHNRYMSNASEVRL